ncbi:hypothetical protein PG994_010284 [Apiospora phragmitis]|uniref:Uncharacterized protein n=1 Tax=Apiospora phragmitis TaxID=2905665 RepID=A0ABR1TPG5_9PEZI
MLPRIWVVAVLHTATVAAAAMARLDSRQDTDGVCDIICLEEDDMDLFVPDPCSADCTEYYECFLGCHTNCNAPMACHRIKISRSATGRRTSGSVVQSQTAVVLEGSYIQYPLGNELDPGTKVRSPSLKLSIGI